MAGFRPWNWRDGNLKLSYSLIDKNGFQAELARLKNIDFERIAQDSLDEIYVRGASMTPVDTGELRMSLGITTGEVGYTKEYAPHVEFGHRLTNGGYVEGQKYLGRNVEIQRPIFEADIRRAVSNAG